MIADLGQFQNVVDDYVLEPFDHTFLNKDIAHFAQVIPTAENIAVHICDLLKRPIGELGAELYKIKLIESPNNSCEVYCTADNAPKDAEVAREPVLARV